MFLYVCICVLYMQLCSCIRARLVAFGSSKMAMDVASLVELELFLEKKKFSERAL